VFAGLPRRPTHDELDGLGAGLATTGSVSMFILPGLTPPFASVEDAFGAAKPEATVHVTRADVDAVYESFTDNAPGCAVDFVHVGCPHASFAEMNSYAELLSGQQVAPGVEMWVTTSRAVRALADQEGITDVVRRAGAKIITDTCPMTTHFARTTSPDSHIKLSPPWMRKMVVDSAKQAKYVRDMIRCATLLTSAEGAVQTAVTGRFVPRSAL
jgi:predicted aconitase